ncbi:hypothetical protein BGZ60DRAFT_432727 [Tricladium varicosporioides]|nr:hypothetical protein BGZ60DRAFT_432727 [Hymenoscyphus varicosporioides]
MASSSRQSPTSTTIQSQPQEFHYFLLLPAELRLKIWSLNHPPPRLIPIFFLPASTPPSQHPLDLQGVTSSILVPANLHACSESRHLALQTYSLAFNLAHCEKKVFFNFGRDRNSDQYGFANAYGERGGYGDSDVMYFGEKGEGYMAAFRHFVSSICLIIPTELAKVRRLAVHEALFVGLRDGERANFSVTGSCLRQFWEYVRTKFTGLEEVTFLCGEQGVANDAGFQLQRQSPKEIPNTRCASLPTPPASTPSTPFASTFNLPTWDHTPPQTKPLSPSLNQHAFFSNPYEEEDNLSWKIDFAVQNLFEEYPEWRVPSWRVVIMGGGKERERLVEEVDVSDGEEWGRVERRVVVRGEGEI